MPLLSFSSNDDFTRENGKKLKPGEEPVKELGSITKVPLMTPNEILNLDEKFAIVKQSGKNPAFVACLFAHMIKEYEERFNMAPIVLEVNSINFEKDHLFDLYSIDYSEWLEVDDKSEKEEYEMLNNELDIEINEEDISNETDNSILDAIENESEIKSISMVQEFNNTRRLLGESRVNKNISMSQNKHNRTLEREKELSEYEKWQIKRNLSQEHLMTQEELLNKSNLLLSELSDLQVQYNKYKNIPQSDLDDSQKNKVNVLYNKISKRNNKKQEILNKISK